MAMRRQRVNRRLRAAGLEPWSEGEGVFTDLLIKYGLPIAARGLESAIVKPAEALGEFVGRKIKGLTGGQGGAIRYAGQRHQTPKKKRPMTGGYSTSIRVSI